MRSTDFELLHNLYGTPNSREGKRNDQALYATPTAAGWIISTSGYTSGADFVPTFEAEARAEGFSVDFLRVLRYGAEQGGQHVFFEQDAEFEPDMPAFDWENGDAEYDPETVDASATPGL